MAPSSSLSTLSMFLSLALAFAFIAAPSFARHGHHKNKKATAEDLCSTTPNPSLCVTLLKSDPRSRNADERGFTEILMDSAYNKANSIFTDLYKLNQESQDNDLRYFYYLTSRTYYDQLTILSFAQSYFNERNYSEAVRIVGVSAEDIKEADNLFKDRRLSSEFKDKHREYEVIISIIQVFVERLKTHG